MDLTPALLTISVFAGLAPAAGAQQESGSSPNAGPRIAAEWLVLAPVDRRGRRPFRSDAVFARHLLDPAAAPPELGAEIQGESGTAAWQAATADASGGLSGQLGWAYAELDLEADEVRLGVLQGASTLFVNGAAFAGDIYSLGFGGTPVPLRAGRNRIFVTGIRGSFRLRFDPAAPGLHLAGWDRTVPHLRAGEPVADWIGVQIWNGSAEAQSLEGLVVGGSGPFARVVLRDAGSVPPFGTLKLALPLRQEAGAAPPVAGPYQVPCLLPGTGDPAARTHSIGVECRAPDVLARRTRRSPIDGSVQEYSVRPPAVDDGTAAPGRSARPALVLSLHGAGVDAFSQASCYSAKADTWIVAATNRRPYGFDWQDWGRQDTYETLAEALAFTAADPDRVYLTGHSMGGHGTWHLAANDPDRFAAIAPSAGWCSFDTYTGRPEGPRAAMWQAADGTSLTLDLIGNLAQLPTFVLHGDADDNVPASEARLMLAALAAAGAEPRVHFQPGAGHWWDGPDGAGVDCLDWPGIFALFAESRRPAAPQQLEWVSVDPGVDAQHYWIGADQPLRYGAPLRVAAEFAPATGVVTVTTENVRRLRIGAPGGARIRGVELDGQTLAHFEAVPAQEAAFQRGEDGWRQVAAVLPAGEKGPASTGPFKRAFDRHFALVVGSAGSAAETAVLLARARHDAGVWAYRGNGRAQIVVDRELLARPAAFAGRNLILYGNADTNAAWERVFGAAAPVQIRRGRIALGEQVYEGGDLGAVFLLPRADSAGALAGAFGDTGVAGARLGDTLAPFVSGVGYPDYCVFSAKILAEGDDGVLAAGWFDHAWKLRP
ncbi:MAG TPA: prolyl oligopeptidase family serine peptidase [Planctomycetota bacterium]